MLDLYIVHKFTASAGKDDWRLARQLQIWADSPNAAVDIAEQLHGVGPKYGVEHFYRCEGIARR